MKLVNIRELLPTSVALICHEGNFMRVGELGLRMPLPINLSFKMGKAAVEVRLYHTEINHFSSSGLCCDDSVKEWTRAELTTWRWGRFTEKAPLDSDLFSGRHSRSILHSQLLTLSWLHLKVCWFVYLDYHHMYEFVFSYLSCNTKRAEMSTCRCISW